MFGGYVKHHLSRRDSIVSGVDVETQTLAVFLTASTSLTSSVVGFTTLEESSSSTSQPTSQPTSTIIVTKTLTTPKQTITSTQLVTSTSSIKKPSPTTSSQSPPPPPPPPPPQQPQPTSTPHSSPNPTPQPPPPPPPSTTPNVPQETPDPQPEEIIVVEPVNQPSNNGPTLMPEQMPTSTLPAEVIPTAFKDLPLSIVSPTTTVPISMPLLVATSSTPAVVLISPSSIYPSKIYPSDPPNAIETVLPKMAGMTAGGKVTAIFGVVLFLGAACLMYQLYYKKKRQAEKVSRLGDNEKQYFGSTGGMATKERPKISSQQNSYPKSTVGLSFNSASEKNFSRDSHRANPFGKHAEVLVDPVNASGPNVIEKVGSEQSFVTCGTSKRGPSAPKPGVGELMGNISNIVKTDSMSLTPASPQEMNTNVATQPLVRPVSAVYRVQLDFTPSMNDELELRSGQLIRVLHEFDDGWAMCVRLDCSEQGVCPRTCLSSRPLKPRSPSTSSSGRPGAQVPQGYYNNQNPKEFAPLPMLPIAQLGPGHTPPTPTAGSNSNVKPPVLPKNNVNLSQHVSEHRDQLPTALPLKNAARYVSLTLPKADESISHSIPELSGSPTPADDYFSFSKPSAESEVKEKITTQLPSPTSLNMGGEIGIPAHYLSEIPSIQKPVPGQAL